MTRFSLLAAAGLAMTAWAAPAHAELTNLEIVFVETDLNGDLSLSKGEILQMAIEQFGIADTNGNELLEADEVGELASDPEFSDNDSDKDGSLSIEEMLTEKLEDFASLDSDDDGALSLDELQAAYGQQ